MKELYIDFENVNGWVCRRILFDEGMWSIFDPPNSNEFIFQSDDIKACIEYMYLYLKYDSTHDFVENSVYIMIYRETDERLSSIGIDIVESKNMSGEMKEVLFKFIDEWQIEAKNETLPSKE